MSSFIAGFCSCGALALLCWWLVRRSNRSRPLSDRVWYLIEEVAEEIQDRVDDRFESGMSEEEATRLANEDMDAFNEEMTSIRELAGGVTLELKHLRAPGSTDSN